MRKYLVLILVGFGLQCVDVCSDEIKAIPDKLVVLTFDDSVKSHYTVVRPLLKKYGFGATFYITEGFSKKNPEFYMTWEEIKALHDEGFEVGNHTRDHLGINDKTVGRLDEQLTAIEEKCAKYGIPKPVTFAWPGNVFTPKAFDVMKKHGILFARRGGSPEYPYKLGLGVGYEPGLDHPLLVPTAGDSRPFWTMENFEKALLQAKQGKVAVLQFHGVPDVHHPWVNTMRERFEGFMKRLKDGGYKVIAMRDLQKYADAKKWPEDWEKVIKERKEKIAKETAKQDTTEK